MAAITASSTLDDIRKEYLANASYEEDGSESKCKAFITAARALLAFLPVAATGFGDDAMVQFSVTSVNDALKMAQRWLSGRATGRVTYVDFRDFRT